jgi:hypothetical protein
MRRPRDAKIFKFSNSCCNNCQIFNEARLWVMQNSNKEIIRMLEILNSTLLKIQGQISPLDVVP